MGSSTLAGPSGAASAKSIAQSRIHVTATGLYAIWTVLVVALALGLRLYALGNLSLWLDEGFTYQIAKTSPLDIIKTLAQFDVHPPLHYLLVWGWMKLAGSSEFALRFVSVFPSVLAVALIAKLGRRWFGPLAGGAAALLLALSNYHIWYSQEVRMYALVCMMGIAAMAAFTAVQRGGGRKAWIALIVFNSLTLYSHYFGFFVIFAEGVVWLISLVGPQFRRRLQTAIPLAIGGLLFSPWLLAISRQMRDAPKEYVNAVPLPDVIWNVASTFSALNLPGVLPAVLVGISGCLVLVGILPFRLDGDLQRLRLVRGEQAEHLILTVVWLVSPILIPFILASFFNLDTHVTGDKYYIVALPAYILLCGRGLQVIGEAIQAALSGLTRSNLIVAPVVTIVLTVLMAVPTWNASAEQFVKRDKENFRAVTAYITERERPGDVIILHSESIYYPFDYYYHGTSPWHRAVMGDEQQVDASLRGMIGSSQYVWLLLSHDTIGDPQRIVEQWFNRNGLVVDEFWTTGMHLLAYAIGQHPNNQAPTLAHPANFRFGDVAELLGSDVPTTLEAGASARLTLTLKALTKPKEDYHLVTMLEDNSGRVWAQSDHVPVAEAYRPMAWLPNEYLTDFYYMTVPLGTPPGDYTVRLFMYAPSTGQRLAVSSGGDRVELAKVHVNRPNQKTTKDRASAASDWKPVDVTDSVRCLRLSPDHPELKAGESMDVEILWQALRAPGADLKLSLGLIDAAGTLHQLPASAPIGGAYGSAQWTSGEIVRSFIAIKAPNDLQGGEYALAVGVGDASSPAVPKIVIGKVSVKVPERIMTRPALDHAQRVSLGDQIAVEGYTLPTTALKPGEQLTLRLCWQSLASPDISYTVFTHLLDANNKVVAQKDALPMDGARPTSTWVKGEYVLDSCTIALPGNLPPGQYRVEVGMYQASNGQRLGVPGADSIILTEPIRVD